MPVTLKSAFVDGGVIRSLDVLNMIGAQRVAQVLANPGAATITTVGLAAAPTLTATAANDDNDLGVWLRHRTTNVANNPSGVISAFTVTKRAWEFEYITRIRTDVALITSIRYWIGLFSASPDLISSPTGIVCAAFRYDTGADGTAFWRTVTSNASATPLVTPTSVAIAAGGVYLLRIVASTLTGDVRFYINDVLVATHTGTTLPATYTLLGFGNRVTTLSAATRDLSWGRVMLMFN